MLSLFVQRGRAVHISILFILTSFAFCMPEQDSRRAHTVPVIYSTDLSHPHDDPDDHFFRILEGLPCDRLDMGDLDGHRPVRPPDIGPLLKVRIRIYW